MQQNTKGASGAGWLQGFLGIQGELTSHNTPQHGTSEGFHRGGCTAEGRKGTPSQHHCTSLHLTGTPLEKNQQQQFEEQNTLSREKGFAQVLQNDHLFHRPASTDRNPVKVKPA